VRSGSSTAPHLTRRSSSCHDAMPVNVTNVCGQYS